MLGLRFIYMRLMYDYYVNFNWNIVNIYKFISIIYLGWLFYNYISVFKLLSFNW